ncbi:hypothetical protein BRADI_2g39491v3 [Brachypodium distachyon]|uniref:Uncharacterized protein n=1 Tax=Brachypodium distachyon TaxID=15368 RepID=A0A2K2DCV4_BRADI|nr:hypothetical protein BRADI_2g39491v3 [Brachypodium distachyon]
MAPKLSWLRKRKHDAEASPSTVSRRSGTPGARTRSSLLPASSISPQDEHDLRRELSFAPAAVKEEDDDDNLQAALEASKEETARLLRTAEEEKDDLQAALEASKEEIARLLRTAAEEEDDLQAALETSKEEIARLPRTVEEEEAMLRKAQEESELDELAAWPDLGLALHLSAQNAPPAAGGWEEKPAPWWPVQVKEEEEPWSPWPVQEQPEEERADQDWSPPPEC